MALVVVIGAAVGLAPAVAGAQSSHFQLMVDHHGRGVALTCADLRFAAVQRLVTPGEALLLEDAGVARCGNRNYVLMLALGARGELTCADVEWNAAAGYLNWSQASEVLPFAPGCRLSGYATLVAIAASGDLACTDVSWWEDQGLITTLQATWLRALVAALQGAPCAPNVPAPAVADAPAGVPFAVTPGAFCAAADAGRYGHTSTGLLMVCTTTLDDSRYRWRQA